MNSILQKLKQSNVEYTLDEAGDVCGLSFSQDSEMTDEQAWDMINDHNMKTKIIAEKPVVAEILTIQEIQEQLVFLSDQITEYSQEK